MLLCAHRCLTTCLARGQLRFPRLSNIDQAFSLLRAATTNRFVLSPPARAASTSGRSDQNHVEAKEIPSERPENPASWVALLDPLLPVHLQPYGVESGETTSCDEAALSRILRYIARARSQYELDLLSYLGIQLNRWTTVHWIVTGLLEKISDRVPSSEHALLSNLVWPSSKDLNQILAENQELERDADSAVNVRIDPDSLLPDPRWSALMASKSVRDVTMEHIWPSLGSMTLGAADMPEVDGRAAMSHVYQILAELHHLGFIPDNIYLRSPASDSTSLPRPPTVHLLSSRILTTLSDAVWRAQERSVAAKAEAAGAHYVFEGHEVPDARYRLKVRELGFEVWLEFILWCCADGGFAREGAWILQQSRKRKEDLQWRAISWTAVEDPTSTSPARAARVDWDKAKQLVQGPFGFVQGYSFDTPPVEWANRTVSSEVVLALIDGLVNVMRTGVGQRGITAAETISRINALGAILHRSGIKISVGHYHTLAIRMLESYSIDPSVEPKALVTLLRGLVPARALKSEVNHFDRTFAEESATLGVDDILTTSELVPGLFHRAIDLLVRKSDLIGAIEVFAFFQELTDSKKKESIKRFAALLNDAVHQDRTQDQDLKAAPQVEEALDERFNTPTEHSLHEQVFVTKQRLVRDHVSSRQHGLADQQQSLHEQDFGNKEYPSHEQAFRDEQRSLVDHDLETEQQPLNEEVPSYEQRSFDGQALRDGQSTERQRKIALEEISGYYGLLPIRVLCAFFDLLTDSEVFEFGRWLLYSLDVDGPLIPPSLYGHPDLAPALFRFAAATSDTSLMNKVVNALDTPMHDYVLRALLNCKIALNEFDSAAQILIYIAESSPTAGGWRLDNIMALAAALIKLDNKPKLTETDRYNIQRCQSLLRRFLQGDFNPPKSYSGRSEEFHGSDERQLSLSAFFLKSIPGKVKEVCVDLNYRPNVRFDKALPARALNHLISAIVDVKGAAEGRRYWDLWCHIPKYLNDDTLTGDGIYELRSEREAPRAPISILSPREMAEKGERQRKPAVPNLSTLRIIVRRALNELKNVGYFSTDSEDSVDEVKFVAGQALVQQSIVRTSAVEDNLRVLAWSIDIFRTFKLNEKEIILELEGVLNPRQQRLRQMGVKSF